MLCTVRHISGTPGKITADLDGARALLDLLQAGLNSGHGYQADGNGLPELVLVDDAGKVLLPRWVVVPVGSVGPVGPGSWKYGRRWTGQ